VGIPYPVAAIEIALGPRMAREMVLFGENMTASAALERGVLDELVPADRSMERAVAMEMCLIGRIIDAAEAERARLVARVVPVAELVDEARRPGSQACRGRSP
jgi:enoyl-CoA hydratase/carnithine racemase